MRLVHESLVTGSHRRRAQLRHGRFDPMGSWGPPDWLGKHRSGRWRAGANSFGRTLQIKHVILADEEDCGAIRPGKQCIEQKISY
jgi:hypothetical protein